MLMIEKNHRFFVAGIVNKPRADNESRSDGGARIRDSKNAFVG